MVLHGGGFDKYIASSYISPIRWVRRVFGNQPIAASSLPQTPFSATPNSLDFSKQTGCRTILGRFMLINIDEFNQVSINQQGLLKHLLQKPIANLANHYGSGLGNGDMPRSSGQAIRKIC